jgi:hypothetical protein
VHSEKDAFGDDEYHPISHRGSNLGSGGGIGYTVVDALDTMLLMGLESEYTRARTWVQEKLSFERHGYFSMFEVRCAFDSAVGGGARCGDGVRATYSIVGQSVPLARKTNSTIASRCDTMVLRAGSADMAGTHRDGRRRDIVRGRADADPLGDELRTRVGGGSRSFPTIPYVVIRFNKLLRME